MNDANSNSILNPFEGMCPPACSQEDAIRKSIFGQALRLLYTASDDDKQQWRLAVEEALSAKRSKAQAKSKDNSESPALKRSRDEDEKSHETREASSAAVPTNTEFIASYLRTLLDKVIGLSLLALPAEALRVFFVILNVPLPSSRSKMALYNTLASYHYTHFEKIGKRVSTSYNADAQQKRDADMMKKTLKTRAAAQSPASSLSAKGVAKEKGEGKSAAAARGAHAEKKEKKKVEMNDEDERLEVMYAPKVFANTGEQHPLQTARYSNNNNNDDDDDDEWTAGCLEKKVASVVQLYDPVTTAVVVKKLALMGYRKPNASETVEKILHSFHARELIFYDNGIAYLL